RLGSLLYRLVLPLLCRLLARALRDRPHGGHRRPDCRRRHGRLAGFADSLEQLPGVARAVGRFRVALLVLRGVRAALPPPIRPLSLRCFSIGRSHQALQSAASSSPICCSRSRSSSSICSSSSSLSSPSSCRSSASAKRL